MGGGHYSRDVGRTSSSGGFSYAGYTDDAAKAMGRRSVDYDLLPKGRKLVCPNRNPIVIAKDVTGSMGDWSKIIYDKMPMMYGQIMMQGYLLDPAISFAGVGDTHNDKAPSQVCDFAQGDGLDSWLKRLWLEGGGGGQGKESYTLTAYFYLHCCEFTNLEGKPFFFFTGDEGFYETIEGEELLQYIGRQSEAVSSMEVLRDLRKKFHVFMVHKTYFTSEDTVILRQWRTTLGEENVLILEDPKAVVDVILGAIALVVGARDLDTYAIDLTGRDQTPQRIASVRKSLGPLSNSLAIVPVDTSGDLPDPTGKDRGGQTERL